MEQLKKALAAKLQEKAAVLGTRFNCIINGAVIGGMIKKKLAGTITSLCDVFLSGK